MLVKEPQSVSQKKFAVSRLYFSGLRLSSLSSVFADC